MNTTVIENCSTHLPGTGKTSTDTCFHKRAFRYFIAVIPVAVVLLISTSYQHSPGKENFPEYGYLNPEAIDSLCAFLTTDAADSTIRIEGEIPYILLGISSPWWIPYRLAPILLPDLLFPGEAIPSFFCIGR